VGQPRTTLGQSEVWASIAVVRLGGLVESVARPEQPGTFEISFEAQPSEWWAPGDSKPRPCRLRVRSRRDPAHAVSSDPHVRG
jgi:hypothetical protein